MAMTRNISLVAVICAALQISSADAYTPYFFDGFDVTAATDDINFEINTLRQGGAPAPISYLTNIDPTAEPPQTYKHQMFDASAPLRVLQVAEDNSNAAGGEGPSPTMISPDFNFNGTLPNGDIIGKRITFEMDVAAMLPSFDEHGVAWTFAGVTVGGDRTLIDDVDSEGFINGDPIPDHFSARFVHDRFSLQTEFMQAYEQAALISDSTGCIGCFLNHLGADGTLSVQIDIDDPDDGNPFDGVGTSVVQVSVNGDPIRNPNNGDVWTYVKDNGGFTNNYITLFGKAQTWSHPVDPTLTRSLATHTFDNFTVWSAPLFPAATDKDGDGDVDGDDFLLIQQMDPTLAPDWEADYGTGFPSQAAAAGVPEPGSLCLLGLVICGARFALLKSHAVVALAVARIWKSCPIIDLHFDWRSRRVLTFFLAQPVRAQYTPYFVDGFDVSAATSNINFEIASRQSGPPSPLSYVTSTVDPSDDFRHQMFDPAATCSGAAISGRRDQHSWRRTNFLLQEHGLAGF